MNITRKQYKKLHRLIRLDLNRRRSNFSIWQKRFTESNIWYMVQDIAYSKYSNTYKPVLLARARYYIHQFKENPQSAAFALEDYKRGLRLMKLNLMESAPGYFKDDRIRFV